MKEVIEEALHQPEVPKVVGACSSEWLFRC